MKPLDFLQLYEDALFYDEEFRERAHEIPFFLRHAQASAGPVLEIACGTGRITLPIAAAEVEIAGVDASAAMIEQARRKSQAAGLAVEWHVQDARRMQLNRSFAMIFSATNALQHLEDLPSLRAFFSRVRVHLNLDGVFILDVFNPSISKLARSLGAPYPRNSFRMRDGRQVEIEADSEYIADAQVLHFILTYRCQGQIVRTKDIRMRCFFPEELLALCELCGFEVLERFGDYDETPFTAASPKQILICRARDGNP